MGGVAGLVAYRRLLEMRLKPTAGPHGKVRMSCRGVRLCPQHPASQPVQDRMAPTKRIRRAELEAMDQQAGLEMGSGSDDESEDEWAQDRAQAGAPDAESDEGEHFAQFEDDDDEMDDPVDEDEEVRRAGWQVTVASSLMLSTTLRPLSASVLLSLQCPDARAQILTTTRAYRAQRDSILDAAESEEEARALLCAQRLGLGVSRRRRQWWDQVWCGRCAGPKAQGAEHTQERQLAQGGSREQACVRLSLHLNNRGGRADSPDTGRWR